MIDRCPARLTDGDLRKGPKPSEMHAIIVRRQSERLLHCASIRSRSVRRCIPSQRVLLCGSRFRSKAEATDCGCFICRIFRGHLSKEFEPFEMWRPTREEDREDFAPKGMINDLASLNCYWVRRKILGAFRKDNFSYFCDGSM